MKKLLQASVLLFCAVSFMGCPKPQKETPLEKLAFKQTELSIFVGDTVRVPLVATPTDFDLSKLTDLTITSSDTNVVKVLNNRVDLTAVNSGTANIKAKSGDVEAILKITARTYEEAWDVEWLYYFPSTKSAKPLNDSIYMVSGFKCRLYSVEYFCPNTLDFDEDLTTGEGYCLFANVASLFIEDPTAGEDDGEMVARQFAIVNTLEDFTTKPFTALAGKIDPAIIGPVFQDYCESIADGEPQDIDWDAYQSGTNGGAHMGRASISDDGSISYAYLWSGIVVSGWAARLYDKASNEPYIDYDFRAQWCYGVLGTGLAVNPEAESWAEAIAQPYALSLSDVYNYKAGQAIAPIVNAPQRKKAKSIEASILADKKNWKKMEKPVKAIRISDLKK